MVMFVVRNTPIEELEKMPKIVEVDEAIIGRAKMKSS